MRTLARVAIAASSLAALAGTAVAASVTYPTKPIRVLVGFAPGGGSDTIGRIVGPKLSEGLGQPIVIDNRPGALSYGSAGHGSFAHLGMELFKHAAGVDMVHVPYKGAGPAMVDLIGGQIQLLFSSAVAAGPALKMGKAKALAVTSARRAKALPELPTIAESGVPNFELSGWYGVVAPAGTPEPLIVMLNQHIARVLALPDVQARLSDDGSEPTPTTPAQFRASIAKEIQRWKTLVQQTKLSL
jgi:tripartite-type tricarboxylate transporter receptor subunit TctC